MIVGAVAKLLSKIIVIALLIITSLQMTVFNNEHALNQHAKHCIYLR